MIKNESNWSAEDLAAIDGVLKRMDNSQDVSIALDRLFFANDEKDVVKKLKEAGTALSRVKEALQEDLKRKWLDSLGKQLRSSVDRAKQNAGRN